MAVGTMTASLGAGMEGTACNFPLDGRFEDVAWDFDEGAWDFDGGGPFDGGDDAATAEDAGAFASGDGAAGGDEVGAFAGGDDVAGLVVDGGGGGFRERRTGPRHFGERPRARRRRL